jgi:hypothetical protein
MLADLNGENPQAVAQFPPGSQDAPFGLALDAAANRLYWTNFPAGKIQTAEASPGAVVEDLITGLSGPVGIVLDSAVGRIYWTESNGDRIVSAKLDGTDADSVLGGLSRPVYLALDAAGGKLYWGEAGIPAIQSANLDGSEKALVRSLESIPTGILVRSAPTRLAAPGKHSSASGRFSLGRPEYRNGVWILAFSLPEPALLRLEVVTVLGKPIHRWVREFRPAGQQRLVLPNPRLPAGMYLLRAKAGSNSGERCCLSIR